MFLLIQRLNLMIHRSKHIPLYQDKGLQGGSLGRFSYNLASENSAINVLLGTEQLMRPSFFTYRVYISGQNCFLSLLVAVILFTCVCLISSTKL